MQIGQISIDGLPAGDYSFAVSLSGYVANKVLLTVGAENITGELLLLQTFP